MAEASCSGATPFKRLVDHQARDSSHHQDRLVQHGGPGLGSFRSAPSAASQTGFESFLHAPPSPAPPLLLPDAAGRVAVHAAALAPAHMEAAPGIAAPDAAAWAADFSRMQGRRGGAPSSSGIMAQPHLQAAPPPAPTTTTMSARPPFSFHAAFRPQPGPALAAPAPEFDAEMARWMASHGGDMSDVDAAMDQMARELQLGEPAAAGLDTGRLTDLETPEIGNLSLHEPEPPSEPRAQLAEDPAAAAGGRSAVSEAAERLLESVEHESGDKWQQSAFLSLMRDFRDGRKDIVDNEIRQTPT